MKNTLVLSLMLTLATVAFGQNAPRAEKLSKQQLQTLIATAKTPVEHERIAHYYEAKAQSDLAQAKQHAQMAEAFRQNPVTNSAKESIATVNHCVYVSQSLTKDAAKMQALAAEHERMAQQK